LPFGYHLDEALSDFSPFLSPIALFQLFFKLSQFFFRAEASLEGLGLSRSGEDLYVVPRVFLRSFLPRDRRIPCEIALRREEAPFSQWTAPLLVSCSSR